MDITELTLKQIQQLFTTGSLTSRTLTAGYLERIRTLDRQGPGLHAVLHINERAMADATAMDAERQAGRCRGILHGVPVLLKDNISTADGQPTTAGSLAMATCLASADATLVTRLRSAGAVVLGKTNLSEWANFRSVHSSSGWSSIGGQTRNPYELDRNPSGSSSGSAVAVAANLCSVAVGTETDGSVVCPASACGIVGIKPTLGIISQAGIIPIASSQDTAGPMARTLTDALHLLVAMGEPDMIARAGLHAVLNTALDTALASGLDTALASGLDTALASGLDSSLAPGLDTGLNSGLDSSLAPGLASGLASGWDTGMDTAGDARWPASQAEKGTRIGHAVKLGGFLPSVDSIMAESIRTLERLGMVIVDIDLAPCSELLDAELTVLKYEFKHGLATYLQDWGQSSGLRNLDDLIAWNNAHASAVMPWFGQDILEAAAATGSLQDRVYLDALATCRRLSRDEGIDAAIRKHDIAAIIAPSGAPAGRVDHILGDHYLGGSSSLAAIAGYPNISIPAGAVHGLPVGLSFFGAAFSDARLASIGLAFEAATKARGTPRYQVFTVFK